MKTFPVGTWRIDGRHATSIDHARPFVIEEGKPVPQKRTGRLEPLLTYNSGDDIITLRVDDKNDPSFWLEINLSRAALALLSHQE